MKGWMRGINATVSRWADSNFAGGPQGPRKRMQYHRLLKRGVLPAGPAPKCMSHRHFGFSWQTCVLPTTIGLSVYRCLAAGIRQRTTACERCSEATYPTYNQR